MIEELLKKDEHTYKTVHRYNSQDNKVETVSYKADGSVDRKITSVYDEAGLLLETYGRLDDGKLYMRDSYLYDRKGNVIEFKNNLRKYLMLYDSRENIISVIKLQRYFKAYDSVQYNISDRLVLDYDQSDNLIEMRTFRPDSALKSRTQYILDESGLLLEEREFNADGRLIYKRNIKYDKGQNIIEESGTDRALKFRNVYKYDARGNKIETTTYDQINEPVSLMKFSFGKYGVTVPALNQNSNSLSDSLLSDDDDALNSEELFQFLGCRIIAPDGTYLGMVLADTANPQSIINSWGQYGFGQSPSSIFNGTTPYGGSNGIFSPFNSQSPSPPSIYKDGKFFAYLTDNDSFRPRSAPHKLVEFLKTLSRQN